MLLDSNICVAFKCNNGQYDLEYISLFELADLKNRFKDIQVHIIDGKEVNFKVKCPLCEKYHCYKYGVKEFIKRKMILGGCEELGIPIFYIGDKDLVEQKVAKFMGMNSRLNAMFL